MGHMQICTLTKTHNHASIPPLSFYRLDSLPAAQPTASKHLNTYENCIYVTSSEGLVADVCDDDRSIFSDDVEDCNRICNNTKNQQVKCISLSNKQCFDAIVWVAGRAPACKKPSGGMLAWLCVWVKVQICIWPSWCHCHSLSLAPVNPDWFYVSGIG